MSELYEVHERPELDAPVLVLGLEGWVDAGLGMGQAVQHIRSTYETTTLATFDTDQLLDYRARRPIMTLRDGVNTHLEWYAIELLAVRDLDGRDTLLMVGAEPDNRWHQFSVDVITLAREFGSSLIATIGAYPAAVPHTRPSALTSTSTTPQLVDITDVVQGELEIPAGISSVIERAGADRDLPAVGVWAQVPHYAASMPYPAASAALLEGLAERAERRFDPTELEEAAARARQRLDELVGESEEHRDMVGQLEALHDRMQSADADLDAEDLPTGDELAAQLQQFLREQEGRGDR